MSLEIRPLVWLGCLVLACGCGHPDPTPSGTGPAGADPTPAKSSTVNGLPEVSAADSPDPVTRPRVRIAAASDLRLVFPELQRGFPTEHPQIDLEVAFGSSGSFFAQFTQQAPFDLFLSADLDLPQRLVDQGDALPDSQFEYARGSLVLWIGSGTELPEGGDGVDLLQDARVTRIAIANPDHAPYGKAALAVLKSWNIADEVTPRLVLADNVAQALQFVDTGAASVGLVSASLARDPRLAGRGRGLPIPSDLHPPLRQGGVILKWARDPAAARALREFLMGPSGRDLLQEHGFQLPEPGP
ncbi:MAG: molybdate ABC transporter substrate-binding protein [Planctomycetaceae bacterium]